MRGGNGDVASTFIRPRPDAPALIGVSQCPLLGVKRTSRFQGVMSAFDPKRTWRFCNKVRF